MSRGNAKTRSYRHSNKTSMQKKKEPNSKPNNHKVHLKKQLPDSNKFAKLRLKHFIIQLKTHFTQRKTVTLSISIIFVPKKKFTSIM